jgi:hypothetical protein
MAQFEILAREALKHVPGMQKRKLPRDSNALAARIVALSTGQLEPDVTGVKTETPPLPSRKGRKTQQQLS